MGRIVIMDGGRKYVWLYCGCVAQMTKKSVLSPKITSEIGAIFMLLYNITFEVDLQNYS